MEKKSTSLQTVPKLKWVETMSRLLDDAFVVPGTNIRFGIDPIIGLIPGIGDALTWIISVLMVADMARHGIPKNLVYKMLLNILIDFLAGLIPIVGDILDVSMKCNRKNWELFQKYFQNHELS